MRRSKNQKMANIQDRVQPAAHQPDSLHNSHVEISRSFDNERIVLSSWRSEWPLVEMKSSCADLGWSSRGTVGVERVSEGECTSLPKVKAPDPVRLMISRAANTQPPYANRMRESPVKLPIAKTSTASSKLLSVLGLKVRPEIVG